jgi:hypothetical protein
VNPLLLLTADVYVAPVTAIMHGLDTLHVNADLIRDDTWEGQPVYVVGAKVGDSTSNQMWVDRDQLRLVRFIQTQTVGQRTTVSDIRVQGYKDIASDVPTEFPVIRNGVQSGVRNTPTYAPTRIPARYVRSGSLERHPDSK